MAEASHEHGCRGQMRGLFIISSPVLANIIEHGAGEIEERPEQELGSRPAALAEGGRCIIGDGWAVA